MTWEFLGGPVVRTLCSHKPCHVATKIMIIITTIHIDSKLGFATYWLE